MCYYVGKYFYVCQNIKAHSNKVKKLYVFKIKGRLDVVNCIEEKKGRGRERHRRFFSYLTSCI